MFASGKGHFKMLGSLYYRPLQNGGSGEFLTPCNMSLRAALLSVDEFSGLSLTWSSTLVIIALTGRSLYLCFFWK